MEAQKEILASVISAGRDVVGKESAGFEGPGKKIPRINAAAGDPAGITRTHFEATGTRTPAGIEAIVSKPSGIEPGGIETAEIDIAGIKNAGSKSAMAATKVYEPVVGGPLGDKAAAIEGAGVDFIVADLSSTREVARAAEEIRGILSWEGRESLDILVNNAGTFSSWYAGTPDGYELQFAVNHLAPFLLTNKLLDLLKKSEDGRIITVSSGSHYRTRIKWDDIFLSRRYNGLRAYKQSKLANVLFTAEVNRRIGSCGNLRAFALDPGLIRTQIGFKGTDSLARWIWKKRSDKGKLPETAARLALFLALDGKPREYPDIYWKDFKPKQPSKYACREEAAKRLWELSERMCGLKA